MTFFLQYTPSNPERLGVFAMHHGFGYNPVANP